MSAFQANDESSILSARTTTIFRNKYMANVAQLVRAPVCGSGGRGFKTHRSPQLKIEGNTFYF